MTAIDRRSFVNLNDDLLLETYQYLRIRDFVKIERLHSRLQYASNLELKQNRTSLQMEDLITTDSEENEIKYFDVVKFLDRFNPEKLKKLDLRLIQCSHGVEECLIEHCRNIKIGKIVSILDKFKHITDVGPINEASIVCLEELIKHKPTFTCDELHLKPLGHEIDRSISELRIVTIGKKIKPKVIILELVDSDFMASETKNEWIYALKVMAHISSVKRLIIKGFEMDYRFQMSQFRPTAKSAASIDAINNMTPIHSDVFRTTIKHIGFELFENQHLQTGNIKSLTLRHNIHGDRRTEQEASRKMTEYLLKLTTLKKLVLLVTTAYNHWDIEQMVRSCPSLRSLCLYIDSNVDFACLTQLSRLEHLEVWLCEPREILDVLENCSTLGTLIVYAKGENHYDLRKFCFTRRLATEYPNVIIKIRPLLSDSELIRYELP